MKTHARIRFVVLIAVSAAGCGMYDFSPSPELQALKKARNAPPPVVAIGLAAQKNAINLGRCNADNALTLAALGTSGSPVTVSASNGITVSFANFLTAVSTLYLDSSCTQPVPIVNGKPTITIAKGMDRRVIYVKALQQPDGGLQLNANADGYSPVTLSLAINTVPTNIRFVSPLTTIGAGLCYSYQARIEDFLGRPVTSGLPAGLTATFRGRTGGIFYSDAACSSQLGSVNSDSVLLPVDSRGLVTVYVSVASVSGFTLAISSSSADISGESKPISVVAACTHLSITGGPVSAMRVGVFDPALFSVVALDVNNNPVAVVGDLAITMTGPADFLPTNAPLKIAAGQSSATFKVRATADDQITIRASAPVGSQIQYGEKTLTVVKSLEGVSVNPVEDVVGGVPTLVEVVLKDGLGRDYIAPAPGFDATLSLPISAIYCNQATCAPGSTISPPKLTYNSVAKRSFYLMVDPDADQVVVFSVGTPSGTFNSNVQLRRKSLAGDKRFHRGPDGQATVSFSGATQDVGLAAVAATNNTVVAAGWTGGDAGDRSIAVTRVFAHTGATPSQPDPSFNSSGKAVLGIGDSSYAIGVATQQIAGGERYVIGVATTTGSDTDFALTRLTASGAIDTSFGTQGKTVVAMPGNQTPRAMAISPNTGYIYLAGSTDGGLGGGNDFLVMAFTPDGAAIPTFGNNGVVQLDVAGNDDAFAIVIPPRGDAQDYPLIGGLAGTGSNPDFALVSLNPTGGLNNAFNPTGAPAGRRIVTVGNGAHLNAIALQGSGKILASGYLDTGETAVVKLTATGGMDTTFDGDGKLVANLASGPQRIFASAFDAQGHFYLAGAMAQAGSSNYDYLLVRLNPDTGALDNSSPVAVGTYDFAGNTGDFARALLVIGGKPLMLGQGYDGTAGRRAFGFQSVLR